MADANSSENSNLKPSLFVLLVVLAIFVASGVAVYNGVQAHDIAIIGFIAFGTIIVLFAAAVLYQIGTGGIPLVGIISEPEDGPHMKGKPKASLSRFQFLVFTFVVAGLFLMLSIEAGQMVDVPTNVLVLIGLSGTGFLAGKAVSNATPERPSGNHEDKPKE
ncbi:hypothetical protein [Hoeflea sp.]|uniref:hypothetical protein n=1 Tax=Hoeflea sp. TaxID=1940281 RepID=UPI003B0247FC